MTKPWYKHFWFWFVIAPPAASIVAGFLLLYIAMGNADDLVVDDYRKIGRAFEQDTERDRVARELGVVARISIDRETGDVGAILDVGAALRRSHTLTLRVTHPTDASRDLAAELEHVEGDLRRGRLPKGPQDRRYLQLSSTEGGWRVTCTLEAGESMVECGAR